jgi:ParB-like nuclease domain
MTALLALDQAEERLRPFSRRYLGIHAIPVTGIVGTDSRSTDFDREFRPLRPDLRSRRQRLAERFPEGQFPPIVVTKLGEAYFVVDGHHRVAVARRLGMATIDAEVTELQAFWRLGPDADVVELLHGEQHRIFMEESGLAEVAPPDVCISFSRLTAYRELLDSVASHGYRLMRERGRVLEPRDVAADRYEHVYLGALETFDREGLEPQATKGDLFLCVQERRRELLLERRNATVEDAVREVLAADEQRARPRLRRLLPP